MIPAGRRPRGLPIIWSAETSGRPVGVAGDHGGGLGWRCVNACADARRCRGQEKFDNVLIQTQIIKNPLNALLSPLVTFSKGTVAGTGRFEIRSWLAGCR